MVGSVTMGQFSLITPTADIWANVLAVKSLHFSIRCMAVDSESDEPLPFDACWSVKLKLSKRLLST